MRLAAKGRKIYAVERALEWLIVASSSRKWGRQSVSALPPTSDINLFGDRERIIDFDTEVSDRAFHLGMAQK